MIRATTGFPNRSSTRRSELLTQMWDQEQRTAICSSQGRDGKGDCINTVSYEDDGSPAAASRSARCRSTAAGPTSCSTSATCSPHPRAGGLKLILKRSGEVFEFMWRFEDTVASE